jgi:alkylation response protein AidB-like acyl-CoA dehydrogenase
VDLQLTDDQVLFDETTARFLEASCPVATVREWAEKEPAGFPPDWWRRGSELGWTSLLVPEDDGGGSISGHGLLDLVLVAEAMGRRVSPGPLVPTNLVASALARSGTAEQRRSLLPGIVSGETVASWCLVEPGTPWPGVAMSAVPGADGFVLDGVKGPVEAGAESDWLLVAAAVDGAPTHFVVDPHAPGVTVSPAESLDLVRRFALVSFDRVVVPPTAVVGEVGGAAGEIEWLTEVAVVLQCAEMAGAVDRMLADTLEYAFDRYSFGRPLASYQALKHRFADLKLWVEACLATAQAAAAAVDRGSPRAGELVSVAKSYIGDHAPLVLSDCVQLHGGIGVTWDHDLHLYLRRVVQDTLLHGTPADHRARIADGLGLDDGPGPDDSSGPDERASRG